MIHKVDPRRNVVDVHEDVLATKRLGEPIVQSTRRTHRVVSSIVYEDPACHADRRAPQKGVSNL
jgi:hypothetical protein